MRRSSRRILLVVLAVAAVLAIFVGMSWRRISLAMAILTSERRPGLLADAQWDDPASARQFQRRFRRGVPEGELLAWLQAEGFSVDRARRRGEKRIGSLPCAERIEVAWRSDARGRIEAARAGVSEAGCL